MQTYRANFFRIKDYREIIRSEYSIRKAKRRAYSFAAYARDLGLPINTLRGVLKNRHGISAGTAEKIAGSIKLTEDESLYFIDLVESQHARTRTEREIAQKRLDRLHNRVNYEEVSEATINLFDRWYYPATLELLSVLNGKIDENIVARKLKISVVEADEALRRLCELGVIAKGSGRYVRSKNNFFAEKKTPSPVIRAFHQQVLAKMARAIELQSIDQRKNLSAIFAFDKSRLEEARNWLAEMYQEFAEEFSNSTTPDSVYAVSLHLAKLDEGEL